MQVIYSIVCYSILRSLNPLTSWFYSNCLLFKITILKYFQNYLEDLFGNYYNFREKAPLINELLSACTFEIKVFTELRKSMVSLFNFSYENFLI